MVKQAAARAGLKWRETNYLLLRRGPYVLAAGLDESVAGDPKQLNGRFVNLFDPELRVRSTVTLTPGSRFFLVDLDAMRSRRPQVIASACKALPTKHGAHVLSFAVEGVVNTPAVLLLRVPKAPRSVTLDGQPLGDFRLFRRAAAALDSLHQRSPPARLGDRLLTTTTAFIIPARP